MRVSRLRATNFRGWSRLDLKRTGHVVVIGEPRAGRTDLAAALARVLDARSTRFSPSLSDLHQRMVPSAAAGLAGSASGLGAVPAAYPPEGSGSQGWTTSRAECAEAELTLVELGIDLEQEVPGVLEPMTVDGQADESGRAGPTAPLGLRLTYRLEYDANADALSHVLYFPALSDPATGRFAKVPSALRHLLPVVFLDSGRPLQLRSEGVLRRLLSDRDPAAVSTALRTLETDIVEAAAALSKTPVIADLLNAILSDSGPARRAGDRPLVADDIQFLPDDGSLAGLLRAVQPVVALDQAGPLALANHGSTTAAVLAASEALILATSIAGAVVIGDDFGEGSTVRLPSTLQRP